MIRFVDVLGMTLPKPRMRDLAKEMELTEDEAKLLLLRCSDRLTMAQIEDLHFISETQQKTLIKIINSKVQLWVDQHVEFFREKELKLLNNALRQYNLPPAEAAE